MEKRLVLRFDGPDVNLGPIFQIEDQGLEIGRWHRYKVAAFTIRDAWPTLAPGSDGAT